MSVACYAAPGPPMDDASPSRVWSGHIIILRMHILNVFIQVDERTGRQTSTQTRKIDNEEEYKKTTKGKSSVVKKLVTDPLTDQRLYPCSLDPSGASLPHPHYIWHQYLKVWIR